MLFVYRKIHTYNLIRHCWKLLHFLVYSFVDREKCLSILCVRAPQQHASRFCKCHSDQISTSASVIYSFSLILFLYHFFLLIFGNIQKVVKNNYGNCDLQKLNRPILWGINSILSSSVVGIFCSSLSYHLYLFHIQVRNQTCAPLNNSYEQPLNNIFYFHPVSRRRV